MLNVEEVTIDVCPYRYGEVEIRIKPLGKWTWFNCPIWIEKGKVDCLLGDVPTKNRKEHEILEKRVIAATLEECPTYIEGFEYFVNEECDGDYNYAIEILTKRNGNVESGSYSNYNKRIKTNIEASPKDTFVHESLNKSVNETRDWDKWEEEWDRRKNSEFGKLLQKLENEMFGMFGEYDEYGINTTPITNTIMAYYDGANNLNKIVSSLEYTFENYDMLHHPHIKRIFNKLYKLAKNNNENKSNMNESLKSSNNKNNIKIAFIPHDNIDPIDDLYDITDNEFLNIAATKGKIYNLKDFEFAYNNLMFKYSHHKYYVRIIY